MNPTATTIPNDWLPHGYCPRDLVPSLRLQKTGGKIVLRLNNAHWYLAIFSLLLGMITFAFWWTFRWGTESNDLRLKWILFVSGCLFLIVGFGSALTRYWFAKYGLSFLIDSIDEVAILKQNDNVMTIPLRNIKGLQVLSRAGNAQLNLLYEAKDRIERCWIHTDLQWHVELLAAEFERLCKIPILNMETIVLPVGTNDVTETPNTLVDPLSFRKFIRVWYRTRGY